MVVGRSFWSFHNYRVVIPNDLSFREFLIQDVSSMRAFELDALYLGWICATVVQCPRKREEPSWDVIKIIFSECQEYSTTANRQMNIFPMMVK